MDVERLSPATCARISEIQDLLEVVMQDARKFSYELNPATAERAGLRPALEQLIASLRARFNGTLRLNVDPLLRQDPEVASAMYHIAREALENSVQHAGCSELEIRVKSTRTGTILEVRDNGRGFDTSDPGPGRGMGLLSIEYYAAQAGLDLSITSSWGGGTKVRAATPEA